MSIAILTLINPSHAINIPKLDLESIGTSLGVKLELFWAQIREVLTFDHGLIIGHSRSWKVFSYHQIHNQVRKVMGGVVQSAMLVCAVGYVGGL